jgi:hypothetical protein
MERVLADAVRCCDAGESPGCPLIDALLQKPVPEGESEFAFEGIA